jgi:hypothetical protein
MSFGTTPVSNTPLGTNQFPVSAVAVPGHANGDLTALKGGPETTDSNNNKEAAVAMYTYDGENETLGAKTNTAATDSTSAWSAIAILKGIFNKLAGILGIQQADLTATGTISAAQPVIGTPVANATVQLALGQGQSSWMAQLTAGAGFTSATTIVVDQSIDGGTQWFVTNFKVAGSLTNTPVQSIVGPGPLLLSGDAASKGILRIRCSVLNASETINVTLRSGAGVGSVGLLSSIPAGSNNIGSINVANVNGNGQNTMVNSQSVALSSDQSPIPIKRNAVVLYSAAQATVGSGNSGDINVGPYTELSIDITTSAKAGTNPTIQFFWNRKGADNVYYPLWQSDILTLSANTISTSIGAGMAYNQSLGAIGQLSWVVGGTATPTWTFNPNVYGK